MKNGHNAKNLWPDLTKTMASTHHVLHSVANYI